MASPICTVNGLITTNGVDVAANAAVTIQLADLAGVGPWSIRCFSTDDMQSPTAITSALTINNITKTATFTAPNVTNGAAMLFESVVNGGLDANGRADASLTTRFGIFVRTASGNLRVGAFDETTEGSSSLGWTPKFNAVARAAAAGGGGGGGSVTIAADAPITVDNSDPTTPVIGFAETIDENGTPSTIVKRMANGAICVPMVESCEGQNLVLRSNGMDDVELDGASTGNLLVPSGIRSSVYMLISETTVQRVIPLHWQNVTQGGFDTWLATDSNDAQNVITGAANDLLIDFKLPHGAKINYISLSVKGAGTGSDALPANPPQYVVVRKHALTGAQTTVGSVSDPLGGSYRGTWRWNQIPCSDHVVDNTIYRYYIRVTPENGTNAIAGMEVRAAVAFLKFPEGYVIGQE